MKTAGVAMRSSGMFKVVKAAMIGLCLAVVGGQALASDTGEADTSKIKAMLTKLGIGPEEQKMTTITASPIAGMFQVSFASGSTVYITADGSHFIAGDLFRVESDEVVNLTEEQRKVGRAELIAKVPLKEHIIFPAKGETKAFVTVFTDIDCGYCAKLHREVPALNDMGIEVRYLAYPRAGLQSASYDKIATAWCADNPQDTLTRLKNRDNSVKMAVCDDNPVGRHMQLGQMVGVRGTPAMVTESGALLPGYMPAPKLAAELGVN
ncbi:bifunctional protein-disulfide isomerase/oxidoreductase DsbC [Maricurvus nonylphenolicus]|uniref:thioredoxin fold domain-containing protein n=1 Tax=Maricurvus nonylphenolicus TaxID=1008307 RepID=UPI0036F44AE1